MVGKEAAIFVPSGTMGNLSGVLAHCHERGSEVRGPRLRTHGIVALTVVSCSEHQLPGMMLNQYATEMVMRSPLIMVVFDCRS